MFVEFRLNAKEMRKGHTKEPPRRSAHFPEDEWLSTTSSSLRSLPAIYRKSPPPVSGNRSTAPRPSVSLDKEGDVWAKKLVLSLDGGGGNGRSQLMLLKDLMQMVRKLEAETNLYSTFEFLPCHYFDYIGGTSTGGLLAIMLGRLRLSVGECLSWLDEIEASSTTGNKTGREAKLGQTDLLGDLAAGKSLDLLERVVSRKLGSQRCESFVEDQGSDGMMTCRTIALCLQKENGLSMPYMFRSYEPRHRTPGLMDRNLTNPTATTVVKTIRAISASRYWQPDLKFERSFMDGSILVNNPSLEIQNEVSGNHECGEDTIDFLLSVGSGDLQNTQRGSWVSSLRPSKKRMFRLMSQQSEHIHSQMEKLSDEGEAFEYRRLGIQADPALFSSNLSKMSIKAKSRMQSEDIISLLKRSDSIRVATEKYLSATQTRIELMHCARHLVKRRRERAQDPCWDAFAHIAYKCQEAHCEFGDTLREGRGQFMNHLIKEHHVKPPDLKHHREMQRKLDAGQVLWT